MESDAQDVEGKEGGGGGAYDKLKCVAVACAEEQSEQIKRDTQRDTHRECQGIETILCLVYLPPPPLLAPLTVSLSVCDAL